GVIDLIKMKAIIWDMETQGNTVQCNDIPAYLVDEANAARESMLEATAESSEEMMDKYLENGDLSEADIIAGIRVRTLSCDIIPMFCGSAFKKKGVQAMLDGVVHFLPSPVDRPAIRGVDENENEIFRKVGD